MCADNWSDEWSQETCQQMNFLGVNENSVIQKPMESDQYFSINATLSVDDIYTVQDARSNYDESCENSIDFECESFGTYYQIINVPSSIINFFFHVAKSVCNTKITTYYCYNFRMRKMEFE